MAEAPRIRIDPQSGVPAVRQIADTMRMLLVEGSLSPGASLPSVRRLAMELGVHFNTVSEAYRQLAVEGWLDLRHGRVATVIERPIPASPAGDRTAVFSGRLRLLIAEMRAEGVTPKKIAKELRVAAEGLLET